MGRMANHPTESRMSTPRLIRDPGAAHLSRGYALRWRPAIPKGPVPPLREPPLGGCARMLAALKHLPIN